MPEGLFHYKVLSFYPDSDGMWAGTEDGLNFYNGYTWKYWRQENDQLSNKRVNFILKDQADYLWLVCTKRGLVICQYLYWT